MSPQARVVRCWLLALGAVWLCFTYPEAALCLFAPLGLMMPVLSPPVVACTNCSTGFGPANYQVVLAGTATFAGCLQCANMDGTYTLPYQSNCNWCGPPLPACTATFGVTWAKVGANYFLRVGNCGGLNTVYEKNYGSTIQNCLNISGVSVPQIVTTQYGCDMSGLTCTVSAA